MIASTFYTLAQYAECVTGIFQTGEPVHQKLGTGFASCFLESINILHDIVAVVGAEETMHQSLFFTLNHNINIYMYIFSKFDKNIQKHPQIIINVY